MYFSSENTSVDSTASNPPASARGTRLEVKRIDKAREPSTGDWRVVDCKALMPENVVDEYAAYDEYVFIFQRTIVEHVDFPTTSFTILIQSNHLQRAVKEVMMVDVLRLSWHSQPLNIDAQLLLAFLPRLWEHLVQLHQNDLSTAQDNPAEHLSFLIDFLEAEYAAVLQEIKTLTSHGEITFDLLWSIFVPPSVIFTLCKTTSEPRAVQLRDSSLATNFRNHIGNCIVNISREPMILEVTFGDWQTSYSRSRILKVSKRLPNSRRIQWSGIYDLKKDEVQSKILERGRRWLRLTGVHHMHYNGMAYRCMAKVKVDGRIMIDRRMFADAEPNYQRGSAPRELLNDHYGSDWDALEAVHHAVKFMQATTIHDDDVLLATPILYGFSLTEKFWRSYMSSFPVAHPSRFTIYQVVPRHERTTLAGVPREDHQYPAWIAYHG